MKSTVTILSMFLLSYTVFGQEDFHNNSSSGSDSYENSAKHPETYKTVSGMVFKVDDWITFGNGTMPTGDFATININGKSWFRTVGSNNAVNANNNSLSKDWRGYKKQIIRFDVIGRDATGYRTFAIIAAGPIRYAVDLDAAIEKGEIVVPEQYRPKTSSANVIQQTSSADEILKYKKLMDDGIITKEEFEEKKKKLLQSAN